MYPRHVLIALSCLQRNHSLHYTEDEHKKGQLNLGLTHDCVSVDLANI